MENNVFLAERKESCLEDLMSYSVNSRGNMGQSVPVAVYRLLEYSFKEQLDQQFGKEMRIQVFRNAGERAGKYFAKQFLDLSLPINQFFSELQKRMEELRIGVLRIEKMDIDTGKIILTVSEDADCSGLPILGETVCNYDEGFIGGILSVYTKKVYKAEEIDCWATGDRVCRFCAEVSE